MTRNEILQAIIDGKELELFGGVDFKTITHKDAIWLLSADIDTAKFRLKPMAQGYAQALQDGHGVIHIASGLPTLATPIDAPYGIYTIVKKNKESVVQFLNVRPFKGARWTYNSVQEANKFNGGDRIAVLKITTTFDGDKPNLPTVEVISHKDALKMGEQ